MKRIALLIVIGLLAGAPASIAETSVAETSGGEYAAVQQRLAQGWNTWNTRSVLQHVLLPQGLAFNLAFKKVAWLEEPYFREALFGRDGGDEPTVTPGLHSYDGSYTELHISWHDFAAKVESAHDGDDLVILVTPESETDLPVKMIVESAILWNRSGTLHRTDRGLLRASAGDRIVHLRSTAPHQEDFYVEAVTPYLVVHLDERVGLATGRKRSVGEIRQAVLEARVRLERQASAFGDLQEAWLAVVSGIAWNTVYEPREGRVVSTVGRLWNEEYGGYCLFGWDNFFLAYMTAMTNRDLAVANLVEHLKGATEEGFIPNDNRGNGSKSFDRSQPPVGGLMVREILKKHPEPWLLEAVFDPLLAWNRFWVDKRMNDGLLSYGSHEAKNPFLEPAVRTVRTAGYESGMDDSPMYEDVPFNTEKNTLELQDVGLTSLVIADSLALAEMADLLGRETDRTELLERAAMLSTALEGVWDEATGLYLNRRTDTGELSHRLSPTLFYPLLTGVPSAETAQRIVVEHLLNPEEFWGEWVLPSTARNDPSFPSQRYWKGAIWPPLNFLSYLALRQADFKDVAGELSEKSLALFLREWEAKGYVSENYSAITGTGDDERLSSDRFHSWGALMGMMAMVEAGHMPKPEATLPQTWADLKVPIDD